VPTLGLVGFLVGRLVGRLEGRLVGALRGLAVGLLVGRIGVGLGPIVGLVEGVRDLKVKGKSRIGLGCGFGEALGIPAGILMEGFNPIGMSTKTGLAIGITIPEDGGETSSVAASSSETTSLEAMWSSA
jgi:hypothetical protein